MEVICPKPVALTAIPVSGCPVKFDQFIRMAFQRAQPKATPPFVVATTDITELASWTPLIAAADDEKIVVSPFFAGMEIPQSEEQVEGGNDNSTINGIEVYKGEGFVKVTGQMKGLSKEQYNALRKLSAESVASLGTAALTVYLFNRFGQIVSLADQGIPVFNFRISSVGSAGFNAENVYNFSFSLAPEWDANVVMVKPEFDPLTELQAV